MVATTAATTGHGPLTVSHQRAAGLVAKLRSYAPTRFPAAFAGRHRQALHLKPMAGWLSQPAALEHRGPRSSFRTAAAAGDSEPRKRVLIPIADGTEEIEAVTVIDVMRRAGAEVVVASVEDGRKQVVCSRGVRIEADIEVREISGRGAPKWDLIAIPGGVPGAEHVADHIKFHSVLQNHFEAGKPMGAICGAPAVLMEPKGFLEGHAATAHPKFAGELGGSLLEKADWAPARVVVDRNIITSQGPGTAMEWALCLVEQLYGPEHAAAVAEPLVPQPLNAAPLRELEWRMKRPIK
eukprot:jgi/Tetstr1/439496/TSEL_027926.t1